MLLIALIPQIYKQAVQEHVLVGHAVITTTATSKTAIIQAQSLEQLKMLPVNSGNGIFALEKIAEIKKMPREEKSLSSLGEKKCIFFRTYPF